MRWSRSYPVRKRGSMTKVRQGKEIKKKDRLECLAPIAEAGTYSTRRERLKHFITLISTLSELPQGARGSHLHRFEIIHPFTFFSTFL